MDVCAAPSPNPLLLHQLQPAGSSRQPQLSSQLPMGERLGQLLPTHHLVSLLQLPLQLQQQHPLGALQE